MRFTSSTANTLLTLESVIGYHHGITVTIRDYAPNVLCGGGPAPDSCEEDLGSMPTSPQHTVFGPVGMPGIDATIPKSFDAKGIYIYSYHIISFLFIS